MRDSVLILVILVATFTLGFGVGHTLGVSVIRKEAQERGHGNWYFVPAWGKSYQEWRWHECGVEGVPER